MSLRLRMTYLAAVVLTMAALTAAPASAQSDFSLTLDSPNQTVAQGGTLTFTGTVSNTSGQAQPPSGFSVSYGANYPSYFTFAYGPSLPYSFTASGAGASYSGVLFTLKASSTTPVGYYGSPYYTTAFNVSLHDQTAGTFSNQTSAPFSVTVTPAPEPSQAAVLGVGMLGVAGLTLTARRRRKSVA